MATDNPRAVDDLTLSKSKKDPLNRVVFYFSAVLILGSVENYRELIKLAHN